MSINSGWSSAGYQAYPTSPAVNSYNNYYTYNYNGITSAPTGASYSNSYGSIPPSTGASGYGYGGMSPSTGASGYGYGGMSPSAGASGYGYGGMSPSTGASGYGYGGMSPSTGASYGYDGMSPPTNINYNILGGGGYPVNSPNAGYSGRLSVVPPTPPEASKPTEPEEPPVEFTEANKSAETNRAALDKFKGMFDRLDVAAEGAKHDNRIKEADMEAALSDTEGRFSEEDKEALRYIWDVQQNDRGHTSLWEGMDGKDDTVNKDGVEQALARDLTPEVIKNNKLAK